MFPNIGVEYRTMTDEEFESALAKEINRVSNLTGEARRKAADDLVEMMKPLIAISPGLWDEMVKFYKNIQAREEIEAQFAKLTPEERARIELLLMESPQGKQ